MDQLEKQKNEAIQHLAALCILCRNGQEHECPVRSVTEQIEHLQGVPVIVNDRLHHVLFI